jgi:phosphatidate cytidylyltransferase
VLKGLERRLPAGILLALIAWALLRWAPVWALLVVLTGIAVVAALEFYRLLDSAQVPNYRGWGIAFCALWVLGVGYAQTIHSILALLLLVCALPVTALAILLRTLWRDQAGSPLLAAAGTLLGVVYIAALWSFTSILMFSWRTGGLNSPLSPTGFGLLLYLLLVVKMADTGAYAVGSLWGRQKLIPRISPGKTREGFWGGLLVGMTCSVLAALWGHGRIGELAFPLWDAALLGLIVALAGTAGDLVESQMKRGAGLKDSSSIVPGLGGMLDLVDSLLFAAPVLYAYAIVRLVPLTNAAGAL